MSERAALTPCSGTTDVVDGLLASIPAESQDRFARRRARASRRTKRFAVSHDHATVFRRLEIRRRVPQHTAPEESAPAVSMTRTTPCRLQNPSAVFHADLGRRDGLQFFVFSQDLSSGRAQSHIPRPTGCATSFFLRKSAPFRRILRGG